MPFSRINAASATASKDIPTPKVPAGQEIAVSKAVGLNCPTVGGLQPAAELAIEHGVGSAEAEEHICPAGHAWHAAGPPSSALYWPSGHAFALAPPLSAGKAPEWPAAMSKQEAPTVAAAL